jgi:hypothetical protein
MTNFTNNKDGIILKVHLTWSTSMFDRLHPNHKGPTLDERINEVQYYIHEIGLRQCYMSIHGIAAKD